MNCNGSTPSLQTSRSSTCALSQQPTLVGVQAPASSAAFRRAITSFRARLSGTDLKDFQTTTYEEVRQKLANMQNEQETAKEMMNLSRIQSFLEAMHQFGKVVEVFLNVGDTVAFIWGPVKFLLLTASTFVDSFETLLDAYEQIGEQMPLLLEYESLFQNDHMREALEKMYTDILEFHKHAMRFFTGKLWKRFFRSMWKDFDTKFGGILKNLRRHKDLIECRASLAQYRLYQNDIEEMNKKLDGLIFEEKSKKMKAVREWLAAGSQFEQDHEDYQGIRKEYPSTGGWITKHETMKDWMDAVGPATPIVWITGIPGAGKTILASIIVDACKQKSPPYVTGYFYCHYDEQRSSTAVGVLRGLLDQLLVQYPDLLPQCHTRYSNSGEPSLRSLPLAKKLLEDFCFTIPKIFLIIDGLDECEQIERKQIVEFFVNVVSQCDVDEVGKMRVLFVSQDYADIRRALHSSSNMKITPKFISLSASDNKDDIQTYIGVWVDKIASEHTQLSEEVAGYLRNLTLHNAKGMFLYAKLVMTNLFSMPTREELMKAINVDFPDGIGQAYERIVRRIRKTSSGVDWEMAKKLLGWMVCAKRQLTKREIQVALSINPQYQTIDYDGRRLRKHINDICGSLVLLSGERVSLVHSTAKTYITKCTKDIHEPSVECDLAVLCLQYLTFPCFDVDQTDQDERRRMALEGQMAFQDYAVAKWFHHVNAFVSSGKDLLKEGDGVGERLRTMWTALDDFQTLYYEEKWDDGIVEECKDNCKVFKDQDLYENLVAITSHVYSYQKKGFEARHKVSIKSLATTLERNRKLLEELPEKLSQDELTTYRQFYDDGRKFKCTRITCMYFSEGFKDAKSRKRHVNIHDRPYQCEVPDCLGNEGFANSKDLEKHKRTYHPEMSDLAETFNTATVKKAEASWACTICGKAFTRNFHRKNHEMSHRGERPYECPECGKAFTRSYDRKRHQKLHDRR